METRKLFFWSNALTHDQSLLQGDYVLAISILQFMGPYNGWNLVSEQHDTVQAPMQQCGSVLALKDECAGLHLRLGQS